MYQKGISICITAYKASNYIKETLNSIRQQTWFIENDNWEVIVGVDGCSETYDYLKCIINEFDSKHYTFVMMDSNMGTYVTSNTIMMQISKYDWLLRFDSDDIMLPHMIETIMNNIDNSIDMIRFKLQNFADKNYTLNDEEKIHKSYTAWGQIAIKHEIFNSFGGYLNWSCSGDAEFIHRTRKFIKTKTLTDVLFNRRITDFSLTNSKKTNNDSDIRKKNLKYVDEISSKIKDISEAINTNVVINTYYKIVPYEFIISLTSFNDRIEYVESVLRSVIETNISRDIYKIVLVLSEEEFTKREKSLPASLNEYCVNNNVEIIWHYRNIRSHKKLIPTLLKYPYMPVLVIDDDILRNKEWLQMFIDDHRKYPNDILCMRCDEYITDDFKCVHDRDNFLNNVNYLDLIYRNRPSNGCGGVLYPSKTFNDKRFFDEDLLMKLSPSSDEMWQYCFNILEGKKIRRTSKMFEFKNIKGTQKKSLYKENNGKYTEILNNLLKYFDDYEYKLKNRINGHITSKDIKGVISLTSWKQRINILPKMLKNLRNVVGYDYRIVLTLSSDEFKNKELDLDKLLLNELKENNIELLWVKENYKVFKKILFSMNKYKNLPIISADDDCLYKLNYAEILYENWLANKNSVITMGHKITYDIYDKKYYFANGRATLYPPNSLTYSIKYLKNKKIISTNNDDSFYGILLNGMKIKYLGFDFNDYIEFIKTNNGITEGVKTRNDFIVDKKIIINELSLMNNNKNYISDDIKTIKPITEIIDKINNEKQRTTSNGNLIKIKKRTITKQRTFNKPFRNGKSHF